MLSPGPHFTGGPLLTVQNIESPFDLLKRALYFFPP
jgi:hypothetical protein